jgi:hypothetical protein
MKKKSIPIAVFVLFISLFCFKTFAQSDPGGSAGGGISQPSPVSFKRNNGNGTCGGVAEIRVSFSAIPDYLPTIEEIRIDGARGAIAFVIDNMDMSPLAQKGYASYCISSGNILPAVKLWIRFHYENSGQDFWVTESLNPTGK